MDIMVFEDWQYWLESMNRDNIDRLLKVLISADHRTKGSFVFTVSDSSLKFNLQYLTLTLRFFSDDERAYDLCKQIEARLLDLEHGDQFGEVARMWLRLKPQYVIDFLLRRIKPEMPINLVVEKVNLSVLLLNNEDRAELEAEILKMTKNQSNKNTPEYKRLIIFALEMALEY